MPVIINEVEIVVSEGGQQGGNRPAGGAPGAGAAPAASAPGPQEILELLRHHADRMERLRAQ